MKNQVFNYYLGRIDYIFSDNKPKTDLALKILTNRSSHFNMEKLKKSLEGLKKNPFIN